MALSHFWAFNVYTDCQSLVDIINDVLQGRVTKSGHALYHSEIWQAIMWHVKQRPPGCINVIKVQAHVTVTPDMDQMQRWLIYGNAAADTRAKEVIQCDHRRIYRKVSAAYKRCMLHRSDHEILVRLMIAANKKCAEKSTANLKGERAAFKVDFNNSAFSCPGRFRGVQPMLELPHELMMAFPWGPIYLWRILQWAQQLCWKPHGTSLCTGDVAFVELLVDFILVTGTWPPRNVSTQSQRNSNYGFGEYILDDLGGAADVQATVGYPFQYLEENFALVDEVFAWEGCSRIRHTAYCFLSFVGITGLA